VLRKVLSIGERMKRDFRVQAYDLFNHPQFRGRRRYQHQRLSGEWERLGFCLVGKSLRLASKRELQLALRVNFYPITLYCAMVCPSAVAQIFFAIARPIA
jgi:hypothetical protein